MRHDRGENLAQTVRVEFPPHVPVTGLEHPSQATSFPPGAEWMVDGNCRQDPEAFSRRGTVALAQLARSRCTVKDQCLERSIKDRAPQDVWSGLSALRRAKYSKAIVAGSLSPEAAVGEARTEWDQIFARMSQE